MRPIVKSALLALSLLTGIHLANAVEPAQSDKHAASAVQFRQALLQLVRSNVGALGAMAKEAIPMDAQTIEKNALRIEQLSLMMDDYFSVDTRKFDVKTDALAKIWQDYPDFQTKITALTDAARTLRVSAEEGQTDSFKANIGAVLKSCKGCHDSYKAD
ncbi:cytochrome c [Aliiglaciecola sp. LCG003]|uniref:c-type cytochrome n=1 Tax=Aliiglaciecola sp. LCG003 TaxID=3053655 RepID=UPI0025729F5D|nr:cytochrome c [Aliiglaciecola sp. LCG003]WJG08032.1 cytochrome c [Aliiglaciecola sp. LCG003]